MQLGERVQASRGYLGTLGLYLLAGVQQGNGCGMQPQQGLSVGWGAAGGTGAASAGAICRAEALCSGLWVQQASRERVRPQQGLSIITYSLVYFLV